jgi:hypothetical protein
MGFDRRTVGFDKTGFGKRDHFCLCSAVATPELQASCTLSPPSWLYYYIDYLILKNSLRPKINKNKIFFEK